jgi:hypothetical protein
MIEARVKYWMPDLEGVVRVDEGGITGTSVDLEDDLGIETDEENVMPLELILHLSGALRLWGSYADMEFTGSARVSDQFVYRGETFLVNSNIESEINLTTTEIGVEFDLVPVETFSLGLCVNGVYFDGTATVTESDLQLSAEGTLSTFVPAIGGFVRISLLDEKLEFHGRFVGLTYKDDTYTDFIIEGRYNVLDNLGVVGGFRSLSVDVEEDLVFVDADLSGFFIGGVLSF